MDLNKLSIAFVVLHTSPLDEPGTKDAGGMNVVVRAQAVELARLGHRVQLITRRSSAHQPDSEEIEPGLTLHHLEAGPASLLAKGDHEQWIGAFSTALGAHLAQHPVDLLHAEHWYSGIAALPVAHEMQVPLVQSFHSIAASEDTPLSAGERPEAPGRLAGEKQLAAEANLLVVVSKAERETVIDRLGADPERVVVVVPGVDTRLFRPSSPVERAEQAAWIARGGRAEALVVGRLDPLKRFDLAIAAVAAVDADRRPSLRIVGAPPPDGDDYARSLHDAVADAGMLGTAAFDGPLRRPLLAERIRRASVVLIPSYSETYGLVALEAAASGVPVIASATGGLRESVIDGETGVLLETDDPRVWASVMTRLTEDRALAEHMGNNARSYALRHGWNASTRSLLAAYRGLLTAQSLDSDQNGSLNEAATSHF